jgi:hypothetical protein
MSNAIKELTISLTYLNKSLMTPFKSKSVRPVLDDTRKSRPLVLILKKQKVVPFVRSRNCDNSASASFFILSDIVSSNQGPVKSSTSSPSQGLVLLSSTCQTLIPAEVLIAGPLQE